MMHKSTILLSLTGLLGAFGTSAQIDVAQFNGITFTESVSTVNCTLANGSSTTCYQLKFFANAVDDSGPFCPSTINDVGGLGFYEPGASGTNVGLAALDANLFNTIEADGFDIVDNGGNININDPGSGTPPTPGTSYCLQASADDDLELVFLIPVTPEQLTTPNVIESVELLGVSLNGIPINGEPPNVLSGPGGQQSTDVKMPALDRCGGHHDPAGYYHWHAISNSANALLTDLGVSSVSCSTFPQDNSGLMGFTMDGYPLYGQFDDGDVTPTGLDQCNGHFGTTPEFPNGTYHYHAVEADFPNIPPCLVGASANNNFSYSFNPNTMDVTEVQNEGLLDVYPNPSSGAAVQINTTGENLRVYDAEGKMVDLTGIVDRTSQGYVIEASLLTPGVYFATIQVNDTRGVRAFIISE